MKKRLMIDLDDVLTSGTWRSQIENFIGTKIDISKTGYYLEKALGNRLDEFFDSMEEIDMYQHAPLHENAYEVMEKLNEKYELYIVSSFFMPYNTDKMGSHLKNKFNYLQEKLPFLSSTQYIFMNNKYLIHFDIGIDDNMKHLENIDTKLLYTAYHNEQISEKELKEKNIIRVNNWLEIADILLKEN